jgi:hypothetical protein
MQNAILSRDAIREEMKVAPPVISAFQETSGVS